jgi:hypothetical protein
MSSGPLHPEPLATPPRIVEGDRVHTGWFRGPIAEPNLEAAPLAMPLGLSPRGRFGAVWRRMRLKQWHYTSVVDDRVLFACAVVDAGYVGNAFAYLVERASGRFYEYSTLQPLAKRVTIAKSSTDGRSGIEAPGWGRIWLDNDSRRGERVIEAHLEGRLHHRRSPPLHARFVIADRGSDPDPVVVVEESEPGRWIYTHKCYGLAAEGTLRAGDIDLEVRDGHAGLDFNRGFRPRQTWWNWAAAGGRSADGDRIGFNLTAHRRWDVPAVSHGDDAADCALWLEGRCVKIPWVAFDYDPRDLFAPWRITDREGLVDLRFTPQGERSENVDLGLLVSRFHQPYGRFEGTLRNREGRTFVLDDVFGVTEQHFARW